MPDNDYFSGIKDGYTTLGNNIIGMNFIKKGFIIIKQAIKLADNFDTIDYLVYNEKLSIYKYAKIITIESNKSKSIGKKSVSDIKKYKKHILVDIKKNKYEKKITFNVISIEFIKSKKPKINIIHEIPIN